MKLSSSSTAKTRERCHHFSTSGRRCSQPACSTHSTLCFTHKPKPQPLPSPDDTLMRELSQTAALLESPEDVRLVLRKIFLALVEDRITVKKAGTMGRVPAPEAKVNGAGGKGGATKDGKRSRPKGRPLHEETDGGVKPPLQETAALVSAPPPQRKLGEHHFQGILRVNGVRQN